MSARSAPAKPMAASSLTSRVGSRSRKPIASSDLMAGTGRQLKPAASLPAKTAAPSSPSTSQECASRCMPKEQPSFEKAMVPVKAAAPPLARSTISHSRQQKPTPPNARLPPSANRLGLSFIGKAARLRHCRSHNQHQTLSHRRALAFIPTIRHPFRDRRGTTAVVNRHQ